MSRPAPQDKEAIKDAVRFVKAEGVIGLLREDGVRVFRNGCNVCASPSRLLDDQKREMVKEVRDHIFTLLVIEEAKEHR